MSPLALIPEPRISSGGRASPATAPRNGFEIRARVHERMAGLLDGRWSEEALLSTAATPNAVRGYLACLREGGALVPGRDGASEDGAGALSALGADARSLSATVGGLSVHVSLDGFDAEAAETHDLAVCFVTPWGAGGLLLSCDRWMVRARRAVAVATLADAAPDWTARAALARWLVSREAGASDGAPVLRVLLHDEQTGELAQVAEVERRGEREPRTLPAQLGLVRPAGREQFPLAGYEAGHPFFPLRGSRFGAHAASVEASLLRAYVARSLAVAGAEDGVCRFRVGALPDPVRAYGEEAVPAERVAAMPVVQSLLDLRLYALERRAEARFDEAPEPAWTDVELLAEAASIPGMGPVVQALRLRRDVLRGRMAERGGLFVFEVDGRRSRSFVRRKAVAELAQAIAWNEFHGESPVHGAAEPLDVGCDYGAYAGRPELRRILARETAHGRAADMRLLARKTELWGVSVWVGDVA